MAENKKVRMQQKRDVTQNWENSGFTPLSGEIIIYNDRQEGTQILTQPSTPPRLKIGDGRSTVDELGAIAGEVYVQESEPKNAGEGAVWIEPNKPEIDPQPGAQADWDAESDTIGHIINKPIDVSTKEINLENSLESMEKDQIQKVGQDYYDYNNIQLVNIELKNTTNFRIMSNRYGSLAEALTDIQKDMQEYPETQYRVIFCTGAIYGFDFTTTLMTLVYLKGEELTHELLGIINDINIIINEVELSQGVYFVGTTEGVFVSKMDFIYLTATIRNEYQSFFKAQKASNIYSIGSFEDWYALIGDNNTENLMIVKDALFAEITKYKKGDIVLVPTIILSLLQQQAKED